MIHFITNEGRTRMSSTQAAEFILVVSPKRYGYKWGEITDVKHRFDNRFNCKIFSSTKPHIILACFLYHEVAEDRIVKPFQQIAKRQAPIKVELKDFCSFRSHTIYINVTSKAPLLNLSRNSKEARELLKYGPASRPFFLTVPHLTIARSLSPTLFEKALLEYSSRNFTGCFIATNMTLLKKRIGQWSYLCVQDFEFLDTPDLGSKQATLFN